MKTFPEHIRSFTVMENQRLTRSFVTDLTGKESERERDRERERKRERERGRESEKDR